ncbi:MAG: hypothetical protein GQ564_13910 [Bacteroidales bacterium]|nr:hypothetical protein [Bacteroidales bacterium]
MRFKINAFGLFISLIIFTACPDNSEEEFNCELKFKIIDRHNNNNNLLQTSIYNSDTIYLFQDNLEIKSVFSFNNVENTLSISTGQLNTYNMDRDFLLYLNKHDTDTLKINYERDPSTPCLGSGLIIKSLKCNGHELSQQGDFYIIEK